MNETQRRFKIGQALDGLVDCDYPDYRMAICLLMGQKPRKIEIHRPLLDRLKAAFCAAKEEYRRKNITIPVKPC